MHAARLVVTIDSIKGRIFIFYGFPLNDKDHLRKWLNAVKRREFQPIKYSKIFRDHFKDKDFLVQPGFRYKRLKKDDAVLSVLPEFPEHLQNKCRERSTKSSRAAASVILHQLLL